LSNGVVALKAIFMLVCLKRLVIFLICGDAYVNVVHLASCLEVVGGVGWVSFCFILCFISVIRLLRKFSLGAICNIFCQYSWRCSWVVGENVYCGICCCRFALYTYVHVGWFPSDF